MAAAAQQAVATAAPWLALSDDALWEMMFGPTLPREWLVSFDGGYCLECGKAQTIYGWQTDPFAYPWKVRCPHCGALFPTNDFAAYYRTGLDAHGIFNRDQADRSLLYNMAHPDPADPLHGVGVDDGWGYTAGDRSWRFIAYLLIRGPWKQGVLGGIRNLATAYLLTGEAVYARKALILLDRVADLYPRFDFKTQANCYEGIGSPGYVSIWHDACVETQQMALAYDVVREGLADPEVVRFLAARARSVGLANPKDTPEAIRRNIEDGLLRHPLTHIDKIKSNYPTTEIAELMLIAILGETGWRATFDRLLDVMVAGASTVDGLTGEKGLNGYAAGTLGALSRALSLFMRLDDGLLPALLRRHPKLNQSWRFHVDTWVDERFYPTCGDGGGFAAPHTAYCGISPCGADPDPLAPSPYPFLMALHRTTGDPLYVQLIYKLNGHTVDGLPVDFFAADAAAFRREVVGVIERVGADCTVGSVNKQEWCLALLRSRDPVTRATAWLDYDAGGNHGHSDAMNLGLYAFGLDLMPDFGYPPVQYGGHDTVKALWYWHPAAHNTVVVDGRCQTAGYAAIRGRTTLWADTAGLRLIRANAPAAGFGQYTFTGTDHERICFYFAMPGAIDRVEVFTEPSPGEGWQPVFADDFKRDQLGPDWQVVSGEWRIVDGVAVGDGVLLCTRRFPGNQRMVYRARSASSFPSNYGVNLAADDRAAGSCLYFAFESYGNGNSRLYLGGAEIAAEAPPVAPRGEWLDITCEMRNQLFRHIINGQIVQEYLNGDDDGQFERTIALADIPSGGSYLLDIFRVVGGVEHVKFQHSTFATLETRGLTPQPVPDYGHDTVMRNSRLDPDVQPGWRADWRIHDHLNVLPPERDAHLHYLDLTSDTEAGTVEQWVSTPQETPFDETWIPALMLRRTGVPPLASTFVAVIEPALDAPRIASARRVAVVTPDGTPYPDNIVGVVVEFADGARDIWLAADLENTAGAHPAWSAHRAMALPTFDLRTDADCCLLRLDPSGCPARAILCRGSDLFYGGFRLDAEVMP